MCCNRMERCFGLAGDFHLVDHSLDLRFLEAIEEADNDYVFRAVRGKQPHKDTGAHHTDGTKGIQHEKGRKAPVSDLPLVTK